MKIRQYSARAISARVTWESYIDWCTWYNIELTDMGDWIDVIDYRPQ